MTKVIQYNDNGEQLAIFNSIAEASRSIGVSRQGLKEAIDNGNHSGGYLWNVDTSPIDEKKSNSVTHGVGVSKYPENKKTCLAFLGDSESYSFENEYSKLKEEFRNAPLDLINSQLIGLAWEQCDIYKKIEIMNSNCSDMEKKIASRELQKLNTHIAKVKSELHKTYDNKKEKVVEEEPWY